MKKNLIALAVAAAVAPGFAAAEGASVSGFADITYTSSSDLEDTADAKTSQFGAAGEIDVRNTVGSVTVGVDVDLDLAPGDTGGSADLEQAFFAWGATEGVTVIGGVFNNPIGLDAEDAPDMEFTSHSAVYEALDSQTVLDGNNIAGVAAAFDAGAATITAAVLNDIQHADDENGDDTHSWALVANASPMEGLDLEFGLVSQEREAVTTSGGEIDTVGVGNVMNFNAVYTMGQFSASIDYLDASEIVKSAYDIAFGFQATDEIAIKFRTSKVSYEDTGTVDGVDNTTLGLEDEKQNTLYASYAIADNLSTAIEFNSYDDGSSDKTKWTTVEFIATF